MIWLIVIVVLLWIVGGYGAHAAAEEVEVSFNRIIDVNRRKERNKVL